METFLRDLMAEQQRQGLCVSALVHASERSLRSVSELCEEQGQRLRVTRVARWFTLAFAPIAPTFPLLLRRCLRETSPDVLHLHMPNLSVFWCLFSPAARRVHWIIHWQADVLASTHNAALRWFYWLYRPFEAAVLRRAARVIATSPPYLSSSGPLKPHRGKCEVVPLGCADLAERPAKAADRALTDVAPERVGNGTGSGTAVAHGLRVLCVGRLTYYKGVRYLIEAVAGLEDLSLTVVGSGDELAALITLTKSLGAEEKVEFVGSLTDRALLDEFFRCDCLCLPSLERTEAFGVVLLEAMRAGKAVVATKVPGSGMNWVVEDGITGVLVEPESAPALAETLAKLRNDAALRAKMGKAGRLRFERRFRIDQTARALLAVYGAIIEEN
jgi:rhamnosyl/mannosyltransferase